MEKESSGRAIDLTDGLNVEDDFSANSPVVKEEVKRSLLTGDALFIVHLGTKLPSEELDNISSAEDRMIVPTEGGYPRVNASRANVGRVL